jgi:precorrin-6A/cobalt-precorrin-6A reductase
MPHALRILILGGTTEARYLAEALAGESDVAPVLSLAGRTQAPQLPPIAVRIGGFGGIDGLIAYLREAKTDLVIDATHPFAEQMSAHAEAACRATGIPLVLFSRPPWQAVEGDRWIEVESADAAAQALGEDPQRVFLTVGRQQLAAFEAAPAHDYLIRSIDAPDPPPRLPSHRLILARGPFSFGGEVDLLRREKIDVLVSKNSGGVATYAKIAAARSLGLLVIMIQSPPRAVVPSFDDLVSILGFIFDRAHHTPPVPRGV